MGMGVLLGQEEARATQEEVIVAFLRTLDFQGGAIVLMVEEVPMVAKNKVDKESPS
jgi:hypothetical protein